MQTQTASKGVTRGALAIASTFSKDSRFFGVDFTPTAIRKGYGAQVLGDDGVWYTDFVAGLGANILGYAHEGLTARLREVLTWGTSYSLPSTLEAQVAERLVDVLGRRVPGWDPDGLGVRFGKTGSDACSMAIRLARAVTGKTRVLASGYHGWHDPFISVTSPAWGVVRQQGVEAWDVGRTTPLQSVVLSGGDVAAVIIEPPMEALPVEFWAELRQACDMVGALLILDEVVTWPRWSLGGAAEYYGIEPDLMALSKALGNGVAVSAIVGRREYFDWFGRQDPCFVSSTFFGETLGLAAAGYVLEHLTDADVEYLWQVGRSLMAGLRAAGWDVIGEPPRSLIRYGSLAERAYFILRMRDAGVLWNRPTLVCMAHTQGDVGKVIRVAKEIKAELAEIDVVTVMAGKEPEVLFSGR